MTSQRHGSTQWGGDCDWMLRTMTAMVRCHSVSSLLNLAYDAIRDGLGYDRVGLMLVDHTRDAIVEQIGTDEHGRKFYPRDRVTYLRDSAYHARLLADPRMSVDGEGFVYMPDVMQVMPPELYELLDGSPDQSLRVALRTSERALGIISVDNLVTARDVSPDDGPRLVAFANALAPALENLLLLENRALRIDHLDAGLQRREAEMEWLQEISRRVNAATLLDEVLEIVYDGIRSGLGYDRVGIQLVDHERGVFEARLGTDPQGRKRRETNRIAPLSADSRIWRVPYLANLLRGAEMYHTVDAMAETPPEVRGAIDSTPRHVLTVALRNGATVTGVIAVDNLLSGRPIEPDGARPLLALAHQVGTAIEKARLLERAKIEQTRLELLLKNAKALNSTLDIRPILHMLGKNLVEMLDAACMSFCRVDLAARRCRSEISYAVPRRAQRHDAAVSESLDDFPILERVMRSGEPFHGHIAAPDFPSSESAYLRAKGLEAELLVPVMVQSEVIGVLEVHWERRVYIGSDTITLCVALAEQAGLAIDNARLHRQAQEAAAAREADRLKSELLGTVSHELRTPLAAIKGFASGLVTYGDEMSPDEHAEAYRAIEDGADRLTELIDNLLEAQRLEAGGLRVHPDHMDVAVVARAAIAEAHLKAPRHVLTLRAECVPPVWADERRMRQILANLIDNAVKYSPGGEPIEISITCEDNWVRLCVSDHGMGIPAEHLEHIFERFHRVDNTSTRRIGGTGLGLAIVQGLVTAQGGRVWAESAGPGHGSAFYVALPAAPQDE